MANPRKDIHDQIWGVLGGPNRGKGEGSGKRPVSLLRQRIWEIIEKDKGRLGYTINLVLLAVILISLVTLPIEFTPGLQQYHSLARTIEIVTTIILTTEYFLRIYAAPQRHKYLFSWQGIVDLVSTLPFYLSFLPVKFLPFVRLLRAVRIVKIIHVRSLEESEEEIKNRSLLSHKVNLMPGEKIEKIAMKHPIFFLLGLILPLVIGAAGVFVLLFWNFQTYAVVTSAVLFLLMIILIYNAWLDYFYDVIYITNFRLIFQNKYLIGYSANQVEYRSITGIRPGTTGIWSALLNFGKIVVETSADQGFIEIDGIRQHEKVAHFIQQKSREWTEVEARRGGLSSGLGAPLVKG